jgi:phosphatidylserine/phosphatidylglycerophosphate/cardiolipin synthase-like enzyme
MREVVGPIAMGPQKLSGMYFVPRPEPLPAWVGRSALDRALEGPVRPIGTTGASLDAPLRRAFIDLIDSAERKVLLASFLFADSEVAEALAKAAERLRGGVYVLTALGRGFPIDLGDPDAPDVAQGVGERREQHFTNLKRLARAGVWLRSAPDFHAKLCVADDQRALVTSANVTAEAFERNPENGVFLDSPELARELGRAFARVFLHHAKEESPPAATLDVGSAPRSKAPRWGRLKSSEPDRVLATISGDERSIVEALIELLKNAKSEIMLTAYSAVGLREHPVGVALRKAIQRGVNVLAVLPPDNRAADRRDTGAWLFQGARTGQVAVRGLAYTHAKTIVVDGASSLVWTGNLDGHHGFEDGFEVGIASGRPDVARSLRAYLIALAVKSAHTALFAPTLGALANAYGTQSGLKDGWVIELPPHAALTPSELADAIERSAVSFARRGTELSLQIEGTGEIIGTPDVAERKLRIERVLWKSTSLSRPQGYLAGCRLSVAKEVGRNSQKDKRNRRGSRQGGGA